jgi:anti-sigma B factor antagonist
MAEFHVSCRHRGSVAVLDLHGQLDRGAGAALDGAVSEALAAGPTRLLLVFDGVVYINSTGIALIVGVLGRARAATVEVAVSGLSEHYRHIFEITRLADFLAFFPDEETAVAGTQPVG